MKNGLCLCSHLANQHQKNVNIAVRSIPLNITQYSSLAGEMKTYNLVVSSFNLVLRFFVIGGNAREAY